VLSNEIKAASSIKMQAHANAALQLHQCRISDVPNRVVQCSSAAKDREAQAKMQPLEVALAAARSSFSWSYASAQNLAHVASGQLWYGRLGHNM